MPSSTPAALDFPARVIIDVYSQEAFKYIKEQENLERSRKLAEMERQAAEAAAAAYELQRQQDGSGVDGGDQQNDADAEGDTSEERIFIKLRGKDTADHKIQVKKVTMGPPFLCIERRHKNKALVACTNSFVRTVLNYHFANRQF